MGPVGDYYFANYSTSNAFSCDANGKVQTSTEPLPNLWSSEYALSITIGMGRMPFQAAKAMDIVWDIVVDRVGQVLVGLLVYRVFRRALVLSMRTRNIPFMRLLAMQYAPVSLMSLMAHGRELGIRKAASLRPAAGALAFVLSVAYALALPAWVSAMTGYQAITEPVVSWTNGTYLDVADLQLCNYNITDGARIGLWDNVCVSPGTALDTSLTNYTDAYALTNRGFSSLTGGLTDFYGVSGMPSVFNFSDGQSVQLTSPTLTIVVANGIYVYDNVTINIQDISDHGQCQPQQIYRWGFSFVLLWSFLVSSSAVGLLIYMVWLYTLKFDLGTHMKYVYGDLSTALEVSAVIHQELGDEANGYSEAELRDLLRASHSGVRLGSLMRSEFNTDVSEQGVDGFRRLSVSSASTFKVEELQINNDDGREILL